MSKTIDPHLFVDNRELSALPQTIVEVLRVIKDDSAPMMELAEILKRDVGLTTKIIRIVNSPLYGARVQIASVPHAVNILGMRAVWALTLSTSVYDMTSNWDICIDRMRFWKHSLQVAIASRFIAENVGYEHPDELFVCGLLHDIGYLFLRKPFPLSARNEIERKKKTGSCPDPERDFMESNHGPVGRACMEKWNMPKVICDTVSEHHNHQIALLKDTGSVPTRIVALANILSSFAIWPSHPVSDEDMEFKEALRLSLSLGDEALEEINKKILAETIVEAKFLEIDIGSIRDILLEANRVIFEQYRSAANNLCKMKGRLNLEVDMANKIRWEAGLAIFEQHRAVLRTIRDNETLHKNCDTCTPDDIQQANEIIAEQYTAMETLLHQIQHRLETTPKNMAHDPVRIA